MIFFAISGGGYYLPVNIGGLCFGNRPYISFIIGRHGGLWIIFRNIAYDLNENDDE